MYRSGNKEPHEIWYFQLSLSLFSHLNKSKIDFKCIKKQSFKLGDYINKNNIYDISVLYRIDPSND